MSAIKSFLVEAAQAGADAALALEFVESGELLWDEAIEAARITTTNSNSLEAH